MAGGRTSTLEQGSASAELVVLTPLLIAFAAVLLLAARLVMAHQAVLDAARTGLEAAVVSTDSRSASANFANVALADLANSRLVCQGDDLSSNVSNFRAGGIVSVQVACQVALASLGTPGLGGTAIVAASATGVIEPFRQIP